MRREVEGLLASHSQSGLFLDVSAPQQMHRGSNANASPPPRADESDRDQLLGAILDGKYELVESLGEGGMGTVYRARQRAPLVREVAVKVVKAGMDSNAILARFDAERQALAIMDHPHIAKVLDAGTTPARQPYFVMELVQGVPITTYCDERRLTPRQRLELFVPVCQAIQHAHQKGIIHRDIKPSNVLVTLYDERPVPKVIDFGVAKAVVGSEGTNRARMTGWGTLIGTPEYMSPEQANLDILDIDTRSDVYSLGVLLYELLTGTTPVDHQSLIRAGLLEVLRIVREVDPPKPSEKLSSVDNLPSVAANRSTDPAHLSKLLKGELDWVVIKALEKDRSRRYETANALGRDIQRYLADELVEARPPGRGYRFRKFVRRYRRAVIAACLMLATLVAGIVGTSWGLVLSQRNERNALAAGDREKAAKEQEIEHRNVAERARERTRDVLDAMVSDVTGDSLTTQKDISPEQKKFLQNVLGYYREFADEPTDDELSRRRHARAARQVGTIEFRLGRKREALEAFRLARAGYASLSADITTRPEYRQELARCHNGVGLMLVALGQSTSALEHYRQGLTILETLVAEFPDRPEYRRDLGLAHTGQGALLQGLGQGAAAAEQFRKGLAIQIALVAEFPDNSEYRHDVARGHFNLGNALNGLGQKTAAEAEHRKGLAIREKLAAEFPAVGEFRNVLAGSHNNLGNLLNALGQTAEAREHQDKALGIQEKLVADFPVVPEYRANLAMSVYNRAVGHATAGQRAAAEGLYRRALLIQEKLAAEFPAVPEYRAKLALSYQSLGQFLAEGESRAAAGEPSRKALANLEQLSAEFPAVPAYRNDLARSHYNLGMLTQGLGQLAPSEEHFRRALNLYAALTSEFPANPAFRQDLARSHNKLGLVLMARGQSQAGNEQHRSALTLREKLAADFPRVLPYQLELGGSYCNYGNTLRDVGNAAESVAWYEKAIDRLRPLVEADASNALARQFLRNSHAGRAQAYHQLRRYADALADWERTIDLSPPAQKLSFRPGRASSLLGSGRVDEALSEVVELTKTPGRNATHWYRFACVYSVASGKIAGKKAEYADRAMELLVTAVKAGYKDAAHMKLDTDLDPLRGRDDFRKLIADLDATAQKPPRELAPMPLAKP